MGSIRSRFLISSLILIPLVLGAMGIVLSSIHEQSLRAGEKEKLRLHTINLMTTTELSGGQLSMPDYLQDTAFNSPASGLYALIRDKQGEILWRSKSTTILPGYLQLPPPAAEAGVLSLETLASQHLGSSFASIWEFDGRDIWLEFIVVSDAAEFNQAVKTYNQSLWIATAVIALCLVAFFTLSISWGLRPLAQLAAEIHELEQGNIRQLAHQYPKEIDPVVQNLNTLLDTEKNQRERYRNTLGNLAHSLKTPLTIVRSVANDLAEKNNDPSALEQQRALLSEQVETMNRLVEYQLQRAVTSSAHHLMERIDIASTLNRLINVMDKVYIDKKMTLTQEVDPSLRIPFDDRDLTEVIGNLLDNAYKYGHSKIAVTLALDAKQQVCLKIEDDGPGIPEDRRSTILQRGTRLDTQNHGQGIGLAVVDDIIDTYTGRLTISESSLGGALFSIYFKS
ncbi:sensory transduction histidine kinase [Oleiphilus messinensis]|uniref:histidine kinase n=1 Tax=Oleiphilus messinensis TaxID=141451 RepID=A0A1Y0IF62_9GAMM|nr:ATP-binding protein [Oleiphilus messinensis]ARU58115.1 sensory transduction histidine kinase [Oleiphilus messinensis]